MKIILRLCLLLLFFSVTKLHAQAHINVDETNLITRLSSLNNSSIADAEKYFTQLGYILVSKQTVPQPKYSMELYKYRLKDQTSSYLLSTIADSVSGSGNITYNEDEYQKAVKTIRDFGFTDGEPTTPESGKTLFAKGNLRFLIQKKTTNDKTFYVMMLSDLLKVARLLGLKK
jgi:hypothetical protein